VVKTFGTTQAHAEMVEAVARLHLSLDNAVTRLSKLSGSGGSSRYDLAIFTQLHDKQHKQLEEMVDIHSALADVGTTWSEWLNRSGNAQTHLQTALAADADETLRAVENSILSSIDICIRYIRTDPVRGMLDRMRYETLEIADQTGLKLQ